MLKKLILKKSNLEFAFLDMENLYQRFYQNIEKKKELCHISKILEMPHIPRETPHLLQGMPLSSTRDAPSLGEMHIPHTSCGISRRRYGVSHGRYCGISKILDM
jgi:hypothetical protein